MKSKARGAQRRGHTALGRQGAWQMRSTAVTQLHSAIAAVATTFSAFPVQSGVDCLQRDVAAHEREHA
jgi:hypothetical protein